MIKFFPGDRVEVPRSTNSEWAGIGIVVPLDNGPHIDEPKHLVRLEMQTGKCSGMKGYFALNRVNFLSTGRSAADELTELQDALADLRDRGYVIDIQITAPSQTFRL